MVRRDDGAPRRRQGISVRHTKVSAVERLPKRSAQWSGGIDGAREPHRKPQIGRIAFRAGPVRAQSRIPRAATGPSRSKH
ncbi:hypothetical protein XAP6164_3040020 [Xanthomonas phaseoli pv. phaseoli]|nr:hypothetical protein XAP6164_3040020 [Xanthomonas phaseoli pv. phaseoli]